MGHGIVDVNKVHVRALIKSIAEEQRQLAGKFILAPVLRPLDRVAVRISGLLYTYGVLVPRRVGWPLAVPLCLWEVVTEYHVMYSGWASREQIGHYLGMLPSRAFVYIGGEDSLALADNEITPIPLANMLYDAGGRAHIFGALHRFTLVVGGFDGTYTWYKGHSDANVARVSAQFEEHLTQEHPPGTFKVKFATPKHYMAYAYVYNQVVQARLDAEKEAELSRELDLKDRVRDALQYAGGELRSVSEQAEDIVRVEYLVGGRTYTTTVREDMSVITAGFCTEGRDQQHDLTTLVDLIKYGQETGHYAVR